MTFLISYYIGAFITLLWFSKANTFEKLIKNKVMCTVIGRVSSNYRYLLASIEPYPQSNDNRLNPDQCSFYFVFTLVTVWSRRICGSGSRVIYPTCDDPVLGLAFVQVYLPRFVTLHTLIKSLARTSLRVPSVPVSLFSLSEDSLESEMGIEGSIKGRAEARTCLAMNRGWRFLSVTSKCINTSILLLNTSAR